MFPNRGPQTFVHVTGGVRRRADAPTDPVTAAAGLVDQPSENAGLTNRGT